MTEEIIEAIKEYYSQDKQTMLCCLKDLYHKTKDYKYINELNKICKTYDLCPKCYRPLKCKESQEYKCEYLGSPSYETIFLRFCYCGWVES